MKQRSDKNLGTKAGTEGERRGAGAQSERGRHADGCLDFFRLCHTGSAAQEANYRARKATEARRRELFDQALSKFKKNDIEGVRPCCHCLSCCPLQLYLTVVEMCMLLAGQPICSIPLFKAWKACCLSATATGSCNHNGEIGRKMFEHLCN